MRQQYPSRGVSVTMQDQFFLFPAPLSLNFFLICHVFDVSDVMLYVCDE